MIHSLTGWLGDLPLGSLYAAIAVLSAFENFFPPFPSDAVIAFGSFLADRARARELLGREGFDVRVTGDGARVLAQDPAPGEAARRGATVSLTLASATETAEVVMPDLRGLSVREAITRLRALAIPVGRVRGSSGRVVDQSPEPGRVVRRETRAVLTLESRGA